MVCTASYSPRAAWLLRRGSRMAGRLSTDWYVVYVETPGEAPDRIDAAAQRHLHDNIAMARELGAEVVRLKARDAVDALLDFARSHGVSHILVGRSQQPRWKRMLGLDRMRRLVREATDIDRQIVAPEKPPWAGEGRRGSTRPWSEAQPSDLARRAGASRRCDNEPAGQAAP